MLGRQRRTTRVDVGLALAFAGVAYLVWALVAGTTRILVRDMLIWWESLLDQPPESLPLAAKVVRLIFVEGGIAIDIVGLVWLAGSLLLVILCARQRFSISWAWVSSSCQSLVAGVGGAWVVWAVHRPLGAALADSGLDLSPTTRWQQIAGISLPVVVALAVVLWTGGLIWLLQERRRFVKRGISLRDGLRTNTFR